MATVLLLRHGRTTANTAGVLAGRTAGVRLDPAGMEQAQRAAQRVSALAVAEIVTSPLERCRQTARIVAGGQAAPPALRAERGLTECDYGEWQGRSLKELAKDPLWRTVQNQPSAATFPGGESLAGMQARAVAAVRRLDASIDRDRGPDAIWVAVSHGDLIKAILADALGSHLDLFQRIQVDPASISIVRYTSARPYVLGMNTHEGSLDWLAPPPRKRRTRHDAVVGGGAGPG